VKVSDRGLALTEQFEGFSATVYPDGTGKPTVGIGHLVKSGEVFDHPLTHAEATALLCKDMEEAECAVEGLVEVPLTQGQFDALCDWTYNLGRTRLMTSTLLKKLNSGDYEGAALEFPKWNRPLDEKGILRRRYAEQLMWRS
jgi:lysozyme